MKPRKPIRKTPPIVRLSVWWYLALRLTGVLVGVAFWFGLFWWAVH